VRLKQISSFCVDHRTITPGIYISRVDGNITTYDLRFIKPNTPPFLSDISIHTIEHLFATFIRNSVYGEYIVYFGPMGCKTGFYLLVKGMEVFNVLALIKKTVEDIIAFTGDVPGSSEIECGNYKLLDLETAKKDAKKYYEYIKNYSETQTNYK